MSTSDPHKRNSDHLEPPEQPAKQPKVDEIELSTEANLKPADCQEPQTCNISIKFHDETTAEAYRTKFLEFVRSFRELCVKCDEGLCIDVYRDGEVSDGRNSPKKHKKHSKAKKELFVVDTTPTQNSTKSELRYTTKFVINTEAEAEKSSSNRSQPLCFNCDGGDHHLRDCPLPKDYNRINMARQKFAKAKPTLGRYHSEGEKYNHLQPGKLSNELRKALGLETDEAPHFIYLMRRLGYPPGWLEDAKINDSSLDVIGIDGKSVKTKDKKKTGLDEKRIIDYPGFNVPFEEGIRDDHRHYRVPPYSSNFCKQAMLDFFNTQCSQEEAPSDEENFERIPTKASKPTGKISPSLVDLEQQKKQLLDELNAPKELPKDEEQNVMPVKTSCFGTPLLKSASPYSKLPAQDHFSKDISPVINFENLPNSTGKYEQLVDVLQKVRTVMKSASIEEC